MFTVTMAGHATFEAATVAPLPPVSEMVAADSAEAENGVSAMEAVGEWEGEDEGEGEGEGEGGGEAAAEAAEAAGRRSLSASKGSRNGRSAPNSARSRRWRCRSCVRTRA